MRKFLPILLILISGCGPYTEYRYSPLKSEKATVIDNLYSPAFHDSQVNMGVNSKGGITFTPTEVNIPPTWGVVFRCQHGKFAITGTKTKHEQLWHKLDVGTEVNILYKELYKVTIDRDTEKEIGREFVDYDFIDAVPAKAEKE